MSEVKQETVVISLALYLWSPYGLAIPFGLGINSTIRSDEELTYASFIVGSNLIIASKWHLYVTKGGIYAGPISDMQPYSAIGHKGSYSMCYLKLVTKG